MQGKNNLPTENNLKTLVLQIKFIFTLVKNHTSPPQ